MFLIIFLCLVILCKNLNIRVSTSVRLEPSKFMVLFLSDIRVNFITFFIFYFYQNYIFIQ